MDLCFRKTKEAQIKTKQNLSPAPRPRSFGHSQEQPGREVVGLGTKEGSDYSRYWSGRRMPIATKGRYFCKCYKWIVPNLWQ